MQIKDENIYGGVRTQYIEWKDATWSIQSNDRFKANDFTMKIYCDVCGPERYVPKVVQYRGNRFCTSCLAQMIRMIQTATFEDCAKDRHDMKKLKKELEKSEHNV